MLIGLCGAAGCGKGSVASILERRRGFSVLSFADPLYEAVSAITGLSVSDLQDREIKEKPLSFVGKSPRYLLQTLGTEWGRNMISPTLWIDACMRRAAGVVNAVIADVRFDNEARAIKDAGGRVFLIVRPGWRTLSPEAAAHTSEAGVGIELVDGFIDNSGTLDDLESVVMRAII